jgi:hypothetical protein
MNMKSLAKHSIAKVSVTYSDKSSMDLLVRYRSIETIRADIDEAINIHLKPGSGKKIAGWVYDAPVEHGFLPHVHVAMSGAHIAVNAPKAAPPVENTTAPAWAELVLRAVTKKEHREGIVGDLHSDFARYSGEKGRAYAYTMCLVDVCQGVMPLLSRTAVRLAVIKLGGSLLKWWGS